MNAALLFLAISVALATPAAQTPAPPTAKQNTVTFAFDRPGLPVPHFTLSIQEDGTAAYHATAAPAAPEAGSSSQAQDVDRTVTLSPATVQKVFKAARDLKFFNIPCASKAKNIADTGRKVLTYAGADGAGTCTYNYSESKAVAGLTDTFLAISYTMYEGQRLESKHRYDRLGLDDEIASLTHAAQEGQALELGTIASTLNAIAGDVDLMQRVRLRAAKLLEQARDTR